jgi:hypothetical protein
VAVQLFGVEAVIDGRRRRGIRELVYRSTRNKVETRLKRSLTEERIPSELAHLFAEKSTVSREKFPGSVAARSGGAACLPARMQAGVKPVTCMYA